MAFLPLVIRAEHRGDFRIHVIFNDDVEATIDCKAWLKGPVFEPLHEPRYFARFFVDGGTVVWPNGADIAPETLYEAAIAEQPKQRHAVTSVREKAVVYKSSAKGPRR